MKGLARSKATSMPWKPTQRSKQKKDASASVFFYKMRITSPPPKRESIVDECDPEFH
jgi:hypothetical protein